MFLGVHLKGSALALYHSLCADGQVQFKILKKALLIKFECTKDGYKDKFRASKPEIEESFFSFAIRLSHLFDRWIEMSGIDKSYEDLRDLMLSEHILSAVSKDLSVFLRERDLKNSQEMVQHCEQYRLAHPTKCLARRADVGSVAMGGNKCTQSTPNYLYAQRAGHTPQRYSNNNTPVRFPYQTHMQGQPKQNTFTQQGQQVPRRGNPRQRGPFRGTGRGRGGVSDVSGVVCHECGGVGHFRRECGTFLKKMDQHKENAAVSMCVSEKVNAEVLCSVSSTKHGSLPICGGTVNGFQVSVLRDSGATTAGVRQALVREDQYLDKQQEVVTFGGNREVFPLAKVDVDTHFFSGSLICCVIQDPVADLILGNVTGVNPIPGLIMSDIQVAAAVETRAQKRDEKKKKSNMDVPFADLNMSKSELITLQEQDPALNKYHGMAKTGECVNLRNSSYSFSKEQGVLVRNFAKGEENVSQVVVPEQARKKVLFVAHDGLLAGHCGIRKTLGRVESRFWWPGIGRDVQHYCRTCEICQKCSPKGRTQDVPLSQMPRIEIPFQRVAIDIVGPFSPLSEEKHRYLLTIVDIATRFPEAVPLKSIDSVSVAEALFSVFCRLGFPLEILSDNGSQFTSEMFKQFLSLLSIKDVHSSPYHAQSNGVVERFHGTIKPMLKKMIQKHPKQWHRHIPPLLFAIRELPNSSTGFSPFQLLFGRHPRGPIDFLADNWLESENENEAKNVCEYVYDLKNSIAEMCEIAHDSVNDSGMVSKMYRDRKCKPRSFQVGDEVLIFLPSTSNKLLMTWKGPYKVVKVLEFDYVIDMGGKQKIFHPNMLKFFHRRTEAASTSYSIGDCIPFSAILPHDFSGDVNCSRQVEEAQVRPEGIQFAAVGVLPVEENESEFSHISIPTLSSPATETYKDINYADTLSNRQKVEMQAVFQEFTPILTTNPGGCTLDIVHNVNLTTDIPVFRKQYPLPFSAQETIKKEIDYMLELDVIEPSSSSFSAPVVLVKKSDGSTRFCCDYRELNKVTITDAEPIPDTEQLFASLADATYFTKIDLTKGYWQILVNPDDKYKTAFQTPFGLYQWTRMPFGLVTAPATFARMMRSLQFNACAKNFFDDILVFSKLWNQHLHDVSDVLKTLSSAGLTARPSKIFAGYQELEFLGHMVGKGCVKPHEKNIKKILQLQVPTSKKQVRSLLGLVGYYRKFIPNFATVTAPISDLLGAKTSRKLTWTTDCQTALDKLQHCLTSKPVLLLADLDKDFVVRTDASSVGVGGVLLQECEDVLHPVMFVSRKLLPRETRYSTIERECLAIIWCVTKLQRYLWGKHFLLQTDHRPLTYLTGSVFKNHRVMRWSLALQEFSFSLAPISGSQNIWADLLSRQ